MADYEVYPSPPVVLVVLEVKHPSADAIGKSERNQLKRDLAKRVPIMKSAQAVSLQIGVGANGPALNVEEFPKYFNRDNTLSISYRQESIVIETSNYTGWEPFNEAAQMAFAARSSLDPLDGIDRVGLRYINEVRAPEDPPDWRQWVHPALFEPEIGNVTNLPLNQWQGFVVYGQEPGQSLALRYGPREGVATVEPNPDLRRPKKVTGGSFFLFDLDSYWMPEGGTPEFEPDKLKGICEDLHEPVQDMFQGLITTRYRDEVLRR